MLCQVLLNTVMTGFLRRKFSFTPHGKQAWVTRLTVIGFCYVIFDAFFGVHSTFFINQNYPL